MCLLSCPAKRLHFCPLTPPSVCTRQGACQPQASWRNWLYTAPASAGQGHVAVADTGSSSACLHLTLLPPPQSPSAAPALNISSSVSVSPACKQRHEFSTWYRQDRHEFSSFSSCPFHGMINALGQAAVVRAVSLLSVQTPGQAPQALLIYSAASSPASQPSQGQAPWETPSPFFLHSFHCIHKSLMFLVTPWLPQNNLGTEL